MGRLLSQNSVKPAFLHKPSSSSITELLELSVNLPEPSGELVEPARSKRNAYYDKAYRQDGHGNNMPSHGFEGVR